MTKCDLLIIGAGPAGYTAAVYAARANLNPVMLAGPLAGGQLTTTTEVENFPGFAEGIMGPKLMEEMRLQAERFGTKIHYTTVTEVDFTSRPFKVTTGDDQEFVANAVIIATGASARMLGLPREKELLGYGLSTCATCDGAFFRNKEIVVVGGGDSACEEGELFTRFGSRVRIVHRRDSFRASKIMSDRVLANPKVEAIWNSELIELHGDQDTGITGARLRNLETGKEEDIQAHGIFYAIGHKPNTDIFVGKLNLDEGGYIVTAKGGTKTSVEGVFACGDVQDHTYRQAITAAGSGCMAAIDAERWLENNS